MLLEDAAPPTPASAPLSVAEATSLLSSAPVMAPPEDQETAEATPETLAAPEAEATDAPSEETVSEGDPEGEVEPPDQAVIEPPANWDADAKAKWPDIPRELQEYLTGLETQRNTAVSTAQREAADVRKAADAEVSQVKTLADELGKLIPRLITAHEKEFGDDPDWAAHAEQVGAEQAFIDKERWQAQRKDIAETLKQEAKANAIAQEKWRSAEYEKLKTLSPDLVHPTEGQARQREVFEYVVQNGAGTPEELASVNAAQLTMAHKAMLYDRLKATTLKTTPKPAPAGAVRPTAAVPQRTVATRNVETLTRRLGQTGSVNDAVALLKARRG